MRSLRARLLAALLLPGLASITLLSVLAYEVARGVLETELGRSVAAAANVAASSIYAAPLLTLQPGDDLVPTRTFRNFDQRVQQLRNSAGARRVYLFDVQGRALADSEHVLPVGTQIPELARDKLELSAVFSGTATSSQVLFQADDGRIYKTGYAPIWHDGHVVAAIGVEASAEFFTGLRALFAAFLWVTVGSLVLFGAVALFTSRSLSRPLNRLMQAALRIGSGDLETPVREESTLEIGVLARELEQMRKALDSRDRQLKMMVAGVAHELRNPLGGMRLHVDLLSEELAQPSPQLVRIRSDLDHLERLSEEFIRFAQTDTLNVAPLESSELLRQTRDLLSGDAQAKRIELEVLGAGGSLQGDRTLLLSALVNLCRNAIQASAEASHVVLRSDVEKDHVLMEVENLGPEISPEQQTRIFEPFYTTREKGSGLGLPLARKIVRAHGGTLTVASTGGRTTFTLRIPRMSP